MKSSTLLLVLLYFVPNQGLECGTGRTGSTALKEALNYCIKNNETLKLIMEMATSSESNSSSMEDPKNTTQTTRTRRSENQVTTEEYNVTEALPTEIFNENPGCMVHCIMERLNMTDENGFPIVEKFTEGLLKTATERELRDFIQDSASECFQQVQEDGFGDECDYSSKLVGCLGTKGRVNCADWPVGNLPI